jgi:PadR family transcriptional regulator PadR
MKGFLSYLILWILGRDRMNGAQITKELEKRKGSKPSPGTVYPALKELKERGLILAGDDKKYSLTKKGEKELKAACKCFCTVFYDVKEMIHCCE